MKHIKIWQLPIENDKIFMSKFMLDRLGKAIDLAEYSCVYECDRPATYTEDTAFDEFNNHHPADYRAHSLSVSDIVEIDGKKFFCDAIGWEEL